MREIIVSLAPARLYEQSEVVPSGGNISQNLNFSIAL